MPARNNRGNVTIRDATRTAVAMEELKRKRIHATIEELCFLCGPCPEGYKTDKEGRLSWLSSGVGSCSRELRESPELAAGRKIEKGIRLCK
jgi:hypothetical protein